MVDASQATVRVVSVNEGDRVLLVVKTIEGPFTVPGTVLEVIGPQVCVAYDKPMFFRCSHTWRGVNDLERVEET